MDLKICSLNVRGLGDKLKRRKTFNWLRRKSYSICMLQEVHCSENKFPYGLPNGDIKHFLVAVPALKEES